MPRGGKRTGKIGKTYGNRTDLNKGPTQSPQAAQSQQYGAAGAQLAAQKAVPLPNVSQVQVQRGPDGRIAGASVAAPQPQAPAGVPPGTTTPLNAPTQLPNQPLTNGIPSGPGQGPSALGLPDPQQGVLDQLRTLYQAYPISQIADLIAEARDAKPS